jgi:hypothetical protein
LLRLFAMLRRQVLSSSVTSRYFAQHPPSFSCSITMLPGRCLGSYLGYLNSTTLDEYPRLAILVTLYSHIGSKVVSTAASEPRKGDTEGGLALPSGGADGDTSVSSTNPPVATPSTHPLTSTFKEAPPRDASGMAATVNNIIKKQLPTAASNKSSPATVPHAPSGVAPFSNSVRNLTNVSHLNGKPPAGQSGHLSVAGGPPDTQRHPEGPSSEKVRHGPARRTPFEEIDMGPLHLSALPNASLAPTSGLLS